MQPADKLIRQIREAIANGGRNAPLETYAADYARLAQEAGQRLDSCAAMIAKGSEYQALQLAETEPVLLDLLALLSFAEAREWTDFCRAEGWPVAPRFDAKAIQALDALYARGISANHPLYKDYRAAVSSRDDARALQIIRSIVRLNPSDANAKAELARIENKLFQLKLHDLRAALAAQDEAAILSELAEIERLGTSAKLAELPEFAEAAEVRRVVAQREAIARAEGLVQSLAEEREAGAWRMVGELLARIEALQSEHGFALDVSAAVTVLEMRRYFETERAAAAETARFQESLRTASELAEQAEARLRSDSSLTSPEVARLRIELDRRWEDVESFPRDVPDELRNRVKTTAAALRSAEARLQSRRRTRIVLTTAAAIVAGCIAGWLGMRMYRAFDYHEQLTRLRSDGEVEAAEKLIATLKKGEPGLAAKPSMRAHLDAVEHWTGDARAQLAAAETQVGEVETLAAHGFEGSEPVALHTQLETIARLIENLAPGLRSRPAGRLAAVRGRFETHLATVREQLNEQAERELAALETLAGAKLGFDQPKDVLAGALEQVEPALKALEARVHSPIPALELPPLLQARVAALRQRADLFGSELALLQRVNDALLQAATIEVYREALGGFKESKLAQVDEVIAARKMLAAFPNPDAVLGSLLVPGEAAAWEVAKADKGRELLAPETVLPAEISELVTLRDDPYLNNIWELTLVDFTRKSERRTIYARGEVKKDGPRDLGSGEVTTWTGAIFDPGYKTEGVGFGPVTFSAQRTPYGVTGTGEISASRRSPVSESLARLELNRMTDAEGAKFEKPLLRVFDDVVRDKEASPLFKAFMMQQLASILNERPFDWGLEYCASLRRDLAKLAELCGDETLRSSDWLLERKRALWLPKLTPFFAELQTRGYLAEARLHREVVRAALKAGLQFGGYFDGAGRARRLGEAAAAGALWAVPADGGAVMRCDGKAADAPEKFARFSPIFFVPLDREAVLAEAARKSGGKVPMPAIPLLASP
jgi:hypothetical protein